MNSLDTKTIKIHEETSHNFDAIKNKEINKQNEILDLYLNEKFEGFENKTPNQTPNLTNLQQQPNSLLDIIQEDPSEIKKKKRKVKEHKKIFRFNIWLIFK
jgi:hypothetical protein